MAAMGLMRFISKVEKIAASEKQEQTAGALESWSNPRKPWRKCLCLIFWGEILGVLLQCIEKDDKCRFRRGSSQSQGRKVVESRIPKDWSKTKNSSSPQLRAPQRYFHTSLLPERVGEARPLPTWEENEERAVVFRKEN